MVVIYKSSSLKQVRNLEAELINYSWEKDALWNLTGGGGGNFNDYSPYFLYLLIILWQHHDLGLI